MKKNQPKAESTGAPAEEKSGGAPSTVSDFKTKEQLEDQAFNHMLLWLAAAAVMEAVVLLLNRFYLNMRVSELNVAVTLDHILAKSLVGGILLCVLCAIWAGLAKRKHPDRVVLLPVILSVVFLVLGVSGFLMRKFGASSAHILLGAIPALAVLLMIFYLYHKEFFGCGIVSALGIFGLWIFRSGASQPVYLKYFIVTLIVMIAGVVLALMLKRRDGVLTIKGKERRLLLPDAAYMMFFVTCILTAVLLLAPLVVGAAVAYYSIWILAAWLFIMAVYFTAKLM